MSTLGSLTLGPNTQAAIDKVLEERNLIGRKRYTPESRVFFESIARKVMELTEQDFETISALQSEYKRTQIRDLIIGAAKILGIGVILLFLNTLIEESNTEAKSALIGLFFCSILLINNPNKIDDIDRKMYNEWQRMGVDPLDHSKIIAAVRKDIETALENSGTSE